MRKTIVQEYRETFPLLRNKTVFVKARLNYKFRLVQCVTEANLCAFTKGKYSVIKIV